jgi:hypothetical protein
MKKNLMMSAVLGAMVISAGAVKADEAADLKELQAQLKMQKQEMIDLLAKMEQIEKAQGETKAQVKDMDWASNIKLKGDLRYRYENVEKDGDLSKDRQRIRARIGAYANVNEEVSVGMRLATGQDANSGNETLDDNWDDKSMYLDLAYMTYAPANVEGLAVTIGKMEKPWYVATDLLWDGDVNPEGIAATYNTEAGAVSLFGTAGYMILNDTSGSTDWEMFAGQIGAESALSDKTKLTVSGAAFGYQNSEEIGGTAVEYTVLQGTAALGVKELLPCPVKFYVDAVTNVKADDENNGYNLGIKFGDAKKGSWEAKVDYRDLEENAAPEDYVDSDFAGGGTGIKGARVNAKYNLSKNFQLGATYIMGENSSGTDVDTLQLDIVAKF